MESHWSGYLKAFEKPVINAPASSNAYPTTSSEKGLTGFLDLTPSRPDIQPRYDAMSGSWEGVQATNKALAHGLFSTDPMPLQKQTASKK